MTLLLVDLISNMSVQKSPDMEDSLPIRTDSEHCAIMAAKLLQWSQVQRVVTSSIRGVSIAFEDRAEKFDWVSLNPFLVLLM